MRDPAVHYSSPTPQYDYSQIERMIVPEAADSEFLTNRKGKIYVIYHEKGSTHIKTEEIGKSFYFSLKGNKVRLVHLNWAERFLRWISRGLYRSDTVFKGAERANILAKIILNVNVKITARLKPQENITKPEVEPQKTQEPAKTPSPSQPIFSKKERLAALKFINRLKEKPRSRGEKALEREALAQGKAVTVVGGAEALAKGKAILKAEAIAKSQQVQRSVLMPTRGQNEILSFLQEELKGKNFSNETIQDIAHYLARELSEWALHPDKYKGKKMHIPAHLLSQKFRTLPDVPTSRVLDESAPSESHMVSFTSKPLSSHKSRGTRTKEVTIPFEFWIEMPPKGNQIKLLMTRTDTHFKDVKGTQKSVTKDFINVGGYKEVFKAKELTFSLEALGRAWTKRGTGKVILKPVPNLQADAHARVKQGEGYQRQLLFRHPDLKIVMPSTPITEAPPVDRLDVSSTPEGTKEDNWFNSDFLSALKEGVPLGIDSQERRPISASESLRCLISLTKTLGTIHDEGLVHRDVKLENCFISLDKNDEPELYLADFDLCQPIGSEFPSAYCYWDKSSERGLVTPNTDGYGVVMALGEVLLPGFFETIHPRLTFHESMLPSMMRRYFEAEIAKMRVPLPEEVKFLQAMIARNPSSEELRGTLRTLLDFANPDTKKILRIFLCRVNAMEAAAQLITASIAKSHVLSEYFMSHPYLERMLRIGTTSEKYDALKIAHNAVGFDTMTTLREKLEVIQGMLIVPMSK